MTNAEIAASIYDGNPLGRLGFITAYTAALDAKDAKRDGYKENYELFVGLMRTASARIESSEAERLHAIECIEFAVAHTRDGAHETDWPEALGYMEEAVKILRREGDPENLVLDRDAAQALADRYLAALEEIADNSCDDDKHDGRPDCAMSDYKCPSCVANAALKGTA